MPPMPPPKAELHIIIDHAGRVQLAIGGALRDADGNADSGRCIELLLKLAGELNAKREQEHESKRAGPRILIANAIPTGALRNGN